jgi:2-polyprenyl-3-methyl-5-hydroxy-6-metoxy-1,4-benzoquinol methylase
MERTKHWENIFKTKDTTKVSWYENIPEVSLKLIDQLNVNQKASILEVGSGDSFLADQLLNKGFENLILLDISETALAKIKERLREQAKQITFIQSDITELNTSFNVDVWHDRAVFHFLNSEKEIRKYVDLAAEKINLNGFLILGTFSKNGPEECSGLKVTQYSEKELCELFSENFRKKECFEYIHKTPSGGKQIFQFCVFQRN